MAEIDDMLSGFAEERAQHAAEMNEEQRHTDQLRQKAHEAVRRYCRSLNAAERTDQQVSATSERHYQKEVEETCGFLKRKVRTYTQSVVATTTMDAWYIGSRNNDHPLDAQSAQWITRYEEGPRGLDITRYCQLAIVYLPDSDEVKPALSEWDNGNPMAGYWRLQPDSRYSREGCHIGEDHHNPIQKINTEADLSSFVRWLDNRLVELSVPWVD